MAEKILIIFISLLILFVYRGFQGDNRYISKRGLVLLFLLVFQAILKIRIIGAGTLMFRQTSAAFYINICITAVGVAGLFFLKKNKKPVILKDMIPFFFLYIPLAIAEQMLFLFIFSETVFSITGQLALSSAITSLYYQEFHPNKHLGKHLFLMYVLSFIWTAVYLHYGGIIWPILSMAVMGPFYYFLLSHKTSLKIKDILKIRQPN